MTVEQQVPEDVDTVVGPHYKPIVDIVLKAWDIWLSGADFYGRQIPGIVLRNRTIGSTMSDILRALFKATAFDLPAIRYRERKGLFFVVIDDEVVIRFNLMDKDGRTLHTPTKQARKYLEQQLLFANKALKYLYAGYVMDATKTEILNVYLLERALSGEPSWMIDMNGNVTKQIPFPFGISVNEEQEETKRVVAKKKKIGEDTQQPKTGTNDV